MNYLVSSFVHSPMEFVFCLRNFRDSLCILGITATIHNSFFLILTATISLFSIMPWYLVWFKEPAATRNLLEMQSSKLPQDILNWCLHFHNFLRWSVDSLKLRCAGQDWITLSNRGREGHPKLIAGK
jgi:hypothetical protein